MEVKVYKSEKTGMIYSLEAVKEMYTKYNFSEEISIFNEKGVKDDFDEIIVDAYVIHKRIIPAKKATLPIFRDIPERTEYYFYNEKGVEMVSDSQEEAEKLVEETKEFFRERKEVENCIKGE